jgi:hypothetical protein
VASYIRALESAAQHDEPGAAGYMRRALDQNPANGFASEFLVQVYFRQRNYGGVADLYRKLGISAFKKSSQALAEITLSCWQTGQKAEALKILAAARIDFPEDPALKNAAQVLKTAR